MSKYLVLLLLSLLRLQRLSLVDVLVLVRLLKGHRTLLLLLFEDVLCTGPSPSIDNVSPVYCCLVFSFYLVRGPVDLSKVLKVSESCRGEEDGTRCVFVNL